MNGVLARSRRVLSRAALRARRFHAADSRLYDQWLSGTPFHAAYWPHRRVRSLLSSRASAASGTMLDLGCGMKPYEGIFAPFVSKHIGLDYSPTSGYRGNRSDVWGDAAAIPLKDGSVDTVLTISLLEHVVDPDAVIAEIARVLRAGGTLIATAPFMFPVHAEADYFRFTAAGWATLLRKHGFRVVEQPPLTGSGLTLAILFNIYWFETGFLSTKWLYPFGVLFRPLLLMGVCWFNALGLALEKALPSSLMALDHLTIARKSEAVS